jgi:hypothetical protein
LLFYAVKSNEIIEKKQLEKQYFGAKKDPKMDVEKSRKTV